jgi:hypothetical protein
METRTITQTKIYYLVMNPVTGRAEEQIVAFVSLSKESLIEAYNNERVEPYDDERFRKSFRKGGPLEWMNRLYPFDVEGSTFGHGIREEWVDSGDLESIKKRYAFVL